ncbi:MAG: F0F1 ATP synthase subunit B [Bacteroidales bacterium]|nr:F0F1 ATP synthase subunit B [Bacteroidales bacterium]MCF8326893.1 F0F1 ATP synthase subunit B [Bacteroidales bacterium]
MGLVTPGLGLIVWMTIAFLIVFFVLAKYAWKPIMRALKQREQSIDEALHEAEKAREEMKNLKAGNEELLKKAKEEREEILKEARKMSDKIVEEAKSNAEGEANRIMEEAKERIHYERMSAVTELKNEVANLSIEIAEKVLKQELSDTDKHQELIKEQLEKVRFN